MNFGALDFGQEAQLPHIDAQNRRTAIVHEARDAEECPVATQDDNQIREIDELRFIANFDARTEIRGQLADKWLDDRFAFFRKVNRSALINNEASQFGRQGGCLRMVMLKNEADFPRLIANHDS